MIPDELIAALDVRLLRVADSAEEAVMYVRRVRDRVRAGGRERSLSRCPGFRVRVGQRGPAGVDVALIVISPTELTSHTAVTSISLPAPG